MQVNLLSVKHFKEASLASLIIMLLSFTFLMVTLPSTAATGDAPIMQALGSGTILTIDGKWSVGEWDDSLEYVVTNSTLISYVRVKWNGSFFYILIDSPWDTTNSSIYPYENTWIAFDTMHNHGSAPQTDDYLFSTNAMVAYRGDGTKWTMMPVPSDFKAQSSSCDEWGPGVQPSPKNSTPHRIDEFRVPLTHVGLINQTGGLYFIVVDDIDDPDKGGPLGSPTYIEWPENSGGRSDGWPPEGRDPCPVPDAWGHLAFVQRPKATFTWDPEAPDIGEIVTFNATSSHDLDGTIANYTWNWGDTSSNVTTNPIITHTFSTPGSYNVNLTVTDNDGLDSSVVSIVNVGVVAAFAFSPIAPNPSDVVTFNATTSFSPGGTVVDYTWDFDDGNVTTISATVVDHTFSTGGSYTVNLTVTDNFTRQAWVAHTVDVGVPGANFMFWPSKPNVEDAIVFDAAASSDPDGIANYTWNWGDTSSNVTTNPIITHTFSTPGSYNVNLTVTDNTGLKNYVAHPVDVYAPREAHFSFSPSTPNVGDAVTFNASLSKDPGGTIANYTWSFDDGNVTTVNATTHTITHIFSTGGSYNVNLTVTDNDGLKSSYNNTVNVGVPPAQATAPFSPTIPTIDGVWSSGEWDDANEYIVSGPGGEGYMLVKWGPSNITGDFLYILIDSPWDTSNATGGVLENAYVAFDTEHDKSTIGPQLDDYLFNDGFSQWNFAWQGNGTIWTRNEINCTEMGYLATRRSGSSPKNATMHRINEFRIPLEFVGNSTSGFYAIIIDSDSDPDGWGPNQPPAAWVEWPIETGGDPRGWPVPPDYIDPCPTLDKWGHLILEPPMKASSNVTFDISSSSITLGESVTISGTVSNSTGTIAEVDVTILFRLTGTTGWTDITTVTTDSTGSYTDDWTPTKAGTYEIKASWAGDADTYGAESEVKTLAVASEPIPILVIVAALAVVAVVVAIAVYLLKVRKPKR